MELNLLCFHLFWFFIVDDWGFRMSKIFYACVETRAKSAAHLLQVFKLRFLKLKKTCLWKNVFYRKQSEEKPKRDYPNRYFCNLSRIFSSYKYISEYSFFFIEVKYYTSYWKAFHIFRWWTWKRLRNHKYVSASPISCQR